MSKRQKVLIICIYPFLTVLLTTYSSLQIMQPDTRYVDLAVVLFLPFGIFFLCQLLMRFYNWRNK